MTTSFHLLSVHLRIRQKMTTSFHSLSVRLRIRKKNDDKRPKLRRSPLGVFVMMTAMAGGRVAWRGELCRQAGEMKGLAASNEATWSA